MEHIAENKTVYEAYINGNIDDHLQDQRCADGRTSSWATEAEIYATATLLQIDIFVHEGEQLLKFAPLSGKSGSATLHVKFGNSHFDFLQPREEDIRIEQTAGNKKATFDWFPLLSSNISKGFQSWSMAKCHACSLQNTHLPAYLD